VWDESCARLVWVDIERCEVHLFDPATGCDELYRLGEQVGAAVPRRGGGYVLACESGFYAYRLGEAPELLAAVGDNEPGIRINDARCDPAGRVWGGTLAADLAPHRGSLYRLDASGRIVKMLEGVTVSNGLDWSPDGETFYYVDSHAYAIQAFDFDMDAGTISRGRPLVEFPRAPWQFPDGLTVDADGFIWVALFGTGRIHRYDPGGTLERVVEVPARLVTSCGFGGGNYEDLYITSATHVLRPDEHGQLTHAGGLFRHRPGVRGRPQDAFAG